MPTLEQLKEDRVRIRKLLDRAKGLDHEPEMWEWLQECERLIAEYSKPGK